MASNPPVKLTSAAGMDTTATSTPTKKPSQGTTTTAIGMPSPTGSTSETSDYQRSTPSPRGEHDSGIGKDRESIRFIALNISTKK